MIGRVLGRVRGTWSGWSTRTRGLVVGGLVAALAGAGLATYLLLKRPADVSNPAAAFVEQKEKKPKPVKTVNWSVYGYDDSRTRYLPTKEVKPPYDASEWSFQAGKLLEFSPIVVDDVLYFQDKDALFYALDAERGKVLWRNEIGDLAASSPAYSDGRLFAVTLEPGALVALRARDGKVLWERPLGSRSESSPVVFGRNVIVGSESGDVFAVDRESGAVRWRVSTADAVKGGLALEDGVLYGANYAGEVFALRASNGAEVWRSSTSGQSLGRGGPVYSTPAVAFGRVYLGSLDGRVYSFDAGNGELAWSQSTGDWAYPGPAVADTPGAPPTVYIGSKDHFFYALDAETGAIRWRRDTGGIVLGAASVLGEVVYVGVIGPNTGTIGYDVRTGKEVFEHELGEYNPVISDGNRLYLTGSSGIRAFEHETAAERRRDAQRRRLQRRRAEEKRAERRERRSLREREGGWADATTTPPKHREPAKGGRAKRKRR